MRSSLPLAAPVAVGYRSSAIDITRLSGPVRLGLGQANAGDSVAVYGTFDPNIGAGSGVVPGMFLLATLTASSDIFAAEHLLAAEVVPPRIVLVRLVGTSALYAYAVGEVGMASANADADVAPFPPMDTASAMAMAADWNAAQVGRGIYNTDHNAIETWQWNGLFGYFTDGQPKLVSTAQSTLTLAGDQYLPVQSGAATSATPIGHTMVNAPCQVASFTATHVGDAANNLGQTVTYRIERSADAGLTWGLLGAPSYAMPTDARSSGGGAAFPARVDLQLGDLLRAKATASAGLAVALKFPSIVLR